MMQVKEDLHTVYKLYWEHKHEDCWLSACVKFVINSVDLFACDTKRLLATLVGVLFDRNTTYSTRRYDVG